MALPLPSRVPAPGFARIPAPTGGLNTVASPELVPNTSAPVIRNLYAHYPGRLTQRGPIDAPQEFDSTSTGGGTYPMIWQSTSSPFTTANFAFFYSTSTDVLLTFGSVISGSPTANGAVKAQAYLSPTFISSFSTPSVQFGDYAYCASRFNEPHIIRWDGSNSDLTGFTRFVNVPFGQPVSAAKYAERMWVADMDVTLGNYLYWTDAGGQTSDALSYWQDDISGLTNKIKLDGTPIALQVISNAMLVFTTAGTFILTGSGNSNFAIKRVSDRVLNQALAVCSYSDGCFFVAKEGLFFYDGVSERLISGPIQDKATVKQTDAALFEVANVGNDFIFFRREGATAEWCGLYHVGTGTWTEFSFPVPSTSSVRGVLQAAGGVFGFSATAVLDLRAAIWSTDQPHGYDNNIGSSAVIDSEWRTHTVRLGTPFMKAHVRQVLVDYAWASTSTTDTGWTYTIYTAAPDQPEGAGTALATGTLPVSGSSTLQRKREVIDVQGEAEDLWIVFTTTAVPTVDTVAELYDVWVEYDFAQQSAGF